MSQAVTADEVQVTNALRIATLVAAFLSVFLVHLQLRLAYWPFLGQISLIWPRFKLVGLNILVGFLTQVDRP